MALKPWYKVMTPREDLREGRPIDAGEFAVHLDQVRDERAPDDYKDPRRFFERTFLTRNLTALAAETVRRLSGVTTETSAVFNMVTQFGGGKTHALTLLYHLAQHASSASQWVGVDKILAQAGVPTVPSARPAVFVGTEFDSISGRGGEDGSPVRKTPWGEIAWQLGGAPAFEAVAEHDSKMIAPAGDVIRRFLPDRPALILIDELMNYVSRSRKLGLVSQLYNFIQNLAEEARGRTNLVVVVSIPASLLEMTDDDHLDFQRLEKLLDRTGKAILISAESETSEIIRRRLFEWDLRTVKPDGTVILNRDAMEACKTYADWVRDHRQQLSAAFPVDRAAEAFAATYPFHPSTISVFERKWQTLPRFQRTRGILRLLALWVSRAYHEGYKGAHKDALIGLGTAPLEDPMFRTALFEQMGESRLDSAITTDIAGKSDAHAVRLDADAVEAIRKARLHRKVATTVLFESNGGVVRAEASLPEVRLAVGEPGLDLGHVETVLETLVSTCYYFVPDKSRYRFSVTPNLNKILADRRASIRSEDVAKRVRKEVESVFAAGPKIARKAFPQSGTDIPNKAVLTLAWLAPDQVSSDKARTLSLIEQMTRSRDYKSALIWCFPEPDTRLGEEVRGLLAWESIRTDPSIPLLPEQNEELKNHAARAERDAREAVWRAYSNLAWLDKDNTLRVEDMGPGHSSSGDTLTGNILLSLKQYGELEDGVAPNFLVRHWSGAHVEWSTRAVRDAFFASPQFPRILDQEVVRDTIARGVQKGDLAYVGRAANDGYDPFHYSTHLDPGEVEICDDMYIIQRTTAEEYLKRQKSDDGASGTSSDENGRGDKSEVDVSEVADTEDSRSVDKPTVTGPVCLVWEGNVPHRKWTTLYMSVLSKIVTGAELDIHVKFEVHAKEGWTPNKTETLRQALRELGLSDEFSTSPIPSSPD